MANQKLTVIVLYNERAISVRFSTELEKSILPK